jgi:long-chain acyl-CoA synthetase
MHCFSALAFDACALTSLLDLRKGHRFFSYLPLAHIVERCALEVLPLLLGAPVSFTEGLDTFLTDLQRSRPTLFISVPRLLLKFQQGVFAKIPPEKLERMLRIPLVGYVVRRRILKGLGLSTVRLAASGAAPLPPDILLWYRRLGLGLAEGYGMTETLITHLPHPKKVKPGYVGAALPGVEAVLTDDGELLIRSPMNMLGYYREPIATAESFASNGFFRTGDIGVIDEDGQLRLIGRIKEQFKTSKGKYVAPAPIESQLNSHPAVESCCLMGAGLPNPFAVVVLSPEARNQCADPHTRKHLEHSLANCINEINGHLDPHERVGFVAVVEGPWSVGNGLMTPTLKVKRVALENTYAALVDSWCAQKRPVIWEARERREGEALRSTA